jgi:hypothetical protein
MNYNVYDLGNSHSGETVVVELSGSAANVRLMDEANYQNYRNGRQHQYHGGLAKQSPIRIQIPHSGHWYVTVDMNGLRGSVRSSVKKI